MTKFYNMLATCLVHSFFLTITSIFCILCMQLICGSNKPKQKDQQGTKKDENKKTKPKSALEEHGPGALTEQTEVGTSMFPTATITKTKSKSNKLTEGDELLKTVEQPKSSTGKKPDKSTSMKLTSQKHEEPKQNQEEKDNNYTEANVSRNDTLKGVNTEILEIKEKLQNKSMVEERSESILLSRMGHGDDDVVPGVVQETGIMNLKKHIAASAIEKRKVEENEKQTTPSVIEAKSEHSKSDSKKEQIKDKNGTQESKADDGQKLKQLNESNKTAVPSNQQIVWPVKKISTGPVKAKWIGNQWVYSKTTQKESTKSYVAI